MERAPHPVEEEHHPQPPHPEPLTRDPDLPTVSDTTLIFFAAGALIVTLVALLVLT
jgi:hypothetical protein